MKAFQLADEAFEELRAEARRDLVALFPLQARIRERVERHIALGPARELASMIRWRLQATRRGFIEYPANLTPDMKLRKEFL